MARRPAPDAPPDEALLGGLAGLLLILAGGLHGGPAGDRLGMLGAVVLSTCLGASLARLAGWLGRR